MLYAALTLVLGISLITQLIPVIRHGTGGGNLHHEYYYENEVLSKSPESNLTVDDIFFYYYPNPSDSSVRIRLNVSDPSSLTNANLTRNTGAKMVIHGILSGCTVRTDFALPVVEAYLKSKQKENENYNVFCVEYTKFVETTDLKLVRDQWIHALKFVGSETAKLIKALHEHEHQFISDLTKVHLIGHSLGGHVVASTGYQVQQMMNGKLVGRISGLDAGNIQQIPYPFIRDKKILLDPSDGVFVDGYHTNAFVIGRGQRYGHIDFYPDEGTIQESCKKINHPEQMVLVENRLVAKEIGCSHNIVGDYWVRSIHNRSLEGCEAKNWKEYLSHKEQGICNNPAVFGEWISTSSKGKYYLDHPIIPVNDVYKPINGFPKSPVYNF